MSEKDHQEDIPLKPVTEGKVIEKTALQKAIGVFLDEDIDEIRYSIFDEYIKPRAKVFVRGSIDKFKEFLLDSLYGIGETFLFPKRKRNGSHGGTNYNSGYCNGTIVNYQGYSSYYSGDDSTYVKIDSAPVVVQEDPRAVKMVGIKTYGKAEEIKGDLIALVKRYTKVSVANYYQLAKAPCTKQDHLYGWKDLKPDNIEISYNAKIGMYVITLPKPIPLD